MQSIGSRWRRARCPAPPQPFAKPRQSTGTLCTPAAQPAPPAVHMTCMHYVQSLKAAKTVHWQMQRVCMPLRLAPALAPRKAPATPAQTCLHQLHASALFFFFKSCTHKLLGGSRFPLCATNWSPAAAVGAVNGDVHKYSWSFLDSFNWLDWWQAP